MDVIKKKLGEQLKAIRNLKGYTQEMLAEKIGINLRQLARIEAGESFIKSDTLYRICVILEISPSLLFDFELEEKLLMTGTDNNMHFNVRKNESVIKFTPKTEIENSKNFMEEDLFDSRMLAMSQKLKKDITVDEFVDNVLVCTKIYTPKGEIKIQDKTEKDKLTIEQLKEDLNKIANDKNKIEYMSLAFKSLYDKKALEQFQFLIKGLELKH